MDGCWNIRRSKGTYLERFYKLEKTLKHFCVGGGENIGSGHVDISGAAGNNDGPMLSKFGGFFNKKIIYVYKCLF